MLFALFFSINYVLTEWHDVGCKCFFTQFPQSSLVTSASPWCTMHRSGLLASTKSCQAGDCIPEQMVHTQEQGWLLVFLQYAVAAAGNRNSSSWSPGSDNACTDSCIVRPACLWSNVEICNFLTTSGVPIDVKWSISSSLAHVVLGRQSSLVPHANQQIFGIRYLGYCTPIFNP